jgi:phosphoribosyl 1,2-cyclic phosphate phosphodiesterase
MGTPVIGCKCETCLSKDPKDMRGRSAALIEWDGKTILIDAGPDIRLQGVRAGIEMIDGLILTHAHSDHTAGLVDLRMIKSLKKAPIPTLLSKETHSEFFKRFEYLEQYFDFSFIPGKEGEMEFMGVPFSYVSYLQGGMDVKGLRFGNFAYITDIKEYDDSHVSALQGVEKLVVSGLQEGPAHVHMTIYESIEFAKRVGAKSVWFNHVSHELTHKRGNEITPDNMHMSYDGLVIEL